MHLESIVSVTIGIILQPVSYPTILAVVAIQYEAYQLEGINPTPPTHNEWMRVANSKCWPASPDSR